MIGRVRLQRIWSKCLKSGRKHLAFRSKFICCSGVLTSYSIRTSSESAATSIRISALTGAGRLHAGENATDSPSSFLLVFLRVRAYYIVGKSLYFSYSFPDAVVIGGPRVYQCRSTCSSRRDCLIRRFFFGRLAPCSLIDSDLPPCLIKDSNLCCFTSMQCLAMPCSD